MALYLHVQYLSGQSVSFFVNSLYISCYLKMAKNLNHSNHRQQANWPLWQEKRTCILYRVAQSTLVALDVFTIKFYTGCTL